MAPSTATQGFRPLAVLLHLTALASSHYAFSSLSRLEELLGVKLSDQFGGQAQFLTINGLAICTATFAVALLRDLMPSLLLTLHHTLLSISLPFEVLISLLYWTLHFVDPTLLAPPRKLYDPTNPAQVIGEELVVVPFSIDASLHALPGVFLLVEFLLFSRGLGTIGTGRATVLAFGAGVVYIVWAEFCAVKNGHFVYPLLNIIPVWQRVLLYLSCSVAIPATLATLDHAYRLVHGNPTERGRKKRN